MARGGNTARPLDIENNDDALEIDSWQGAANNDSEVKITGISGDGAAAVAKDNVVSLTLGRTPPKTQPIPRRNFRPKTMRTPPAMADETANNSSTIQNDGIKTPPTLGVANDGGQSFEDGLAATVPAAKNTTPFAGTPQESGAEPGASLEKGDLVPDTLADAPATTTRQIPQQAANISPAEQSQAATDLQQTRQGAATTKTDDNATENENLPPLFTAIASRFQSFGTLVRMYRAAAPAAKLKILNRMQQFVSFAKFDAAITDGAEQWALVFTPLIPITFGLILIVAIPALAIQLLFYGVLQETAPSLLAKELAEVKKIIDTMIAKVQEKIQNEQQKQRNVRQATQRRQAIIQAQAAEQSAG